MIGCKSWRAGGFYLLQVTYLLSAHTWRRRDEACSFHEKPVRTIIALEQNLSISVGVVEEPESLSTVHNQKLNGQKKSSQKYIINIKMKYFWVGRRLSEMETAEVSC